jgi:predicted enzyme related to lactoylglutathione lyase
MKSGARWAGSSRVKRSALTPDGEYPGLTLHDRNSIGAAMPSPITAGAVIYAKDLPRVSAFYAEVVGLEVTHAEQDHVELESESFQLVVHAIPPGIAASIEIADPPIRREDTAVKLVFPVPSISRSRTLAADHGGEVDPPEREWRFQGYRVCDGHDPEGNVIQFREPD